MSSWISDSNVRSSNSTGISDNFFLVFLNFFRQIVGYRLEITHDNFLPRTSIRESSNPNIWCYITYEVGWIVAAEINDFRMRLEETASILRRQLAPYLISSARCGKGWPSRLVLDRELTSFQLKESVSCGVLHRGDWWGMYHAWEKREIL
jgi:hypothetical protein